MLASWQRIGLGHRNFTRVFIGPQKFLLKESMWTEKNLPVEKENTTILQAANQERKQIGAALKRKSSERSQIQKKKEDI